MQTISPVEVCFRNDDVNYLTPELRAVTGLFLDRGVPITHAVEPGNVSEECVRWLRATKATHPGLIEIVQHGWDHTRYDRGEFDETRGYDQQLDDMRRGKATLEARFGEDFFPAMTFPFAAYTQHSIDAADAAGFRVFCIPITYALPKRVLDHGGRIMGRRSLFGRPIYYHLQRIPRTALLSVGNVLDFIKRYNGKHESNECEFWDAGSLLDAFQTHRRRSPVLVISLHHRFHHSPAHLDLVRIVLDALRAEPNVTFTTYASILEHYEPDAPARTLPSGQPAVDGGRVLVRSGVSRELARQ